MNGGPLSDLRVIEVGDFISAPYAAKMLADLGAEVIKIEDPQAPDSARDFGPFPQDLPDPAHSGLYAYLNANKLGVTLSLRSATGRALFQRLAAEADVVLDGDPSRPLPALGLGYETLERINPRLVVTSVTPFGLTGPYAGFKANDMIAFHASGAGHRQIGYPDREPIRAAWYHADHWGAVNAAAATMLALEARQHIGRGQRVDVSSAESLAMLFVSFNNVGPYWDHHLVLGRTGYIWTGTYLGVLPCKDGYVFVFTPDDHMWEGMLKALDDPEWAKDPLFAGREGRAEYAEEIVALLTEALRDRTKEEFFQRSQANRAPNAPVYDLREVFENRHLRVRDYFVDLPTTGGETYEVPGPPYRFAEGGWSLRRPAPALGEHNEAVYCNRLGLGRTELAALRQAQVI